MWHGATRKLNIARIQISRLESPLPGHLSLAKGDSNMIHILLLLVIMLRSRFSWANSFNWLEVRMPRPLLSYSLILWQPCSVARVSKCTPLESISIVQMVVGEDNWPSQLTLALNNEMIHINIKLKLDVSPETQRLKATLSNVQSIQYQYLSPTLAKFQKSGNIDKLPHF